MDESRQNLLPSGTAIEMEELRSDDKLGLDYEDTRLVEPERRRQMRRGSDGASIVDAAIGGAASTASVAAEEKRLINATLLKNMGINAFLIALWYSFSISISVYNKWMFSKDNLDFHFPLFTTSVHMLIQFVCASAVLFFIPRYRPTANPDNPNEAHYSQLDDTETDDPGAEQPSKPPPSKKPLMTKTFYLTRIAPCGTATALDIGLGNFSLRFISLTFYTMCKSSVLAFVLAFAFLFHLEKPTWRVCVIILFMTGGVIMMVAGETAFDGGGFALVMSASACSGLRWSLTQILLLRNKPTSNPFSASFFLTPVMFLALFVLALPVEGPYNVARGVQELAKAEGGFLSLLILLFPGCLAFLMVTAEFALLKRTSVVTLSVCGIFKEVLTISAAGIIFGDELTPINVSGLLVTLASIAAYNWLKYSKMRDKTTKEVQEVLADETGIGQAQKELGDDEDAGRISSADGLMRDDLGFAANLNGRHTKKYSISDRPGKRPEDLE